MKRLALAFAAVVAFVLVVGVGASGSTYANGHFVSGVGYYTTAPGTPVPLDVSGNWKIDVDAAGIGHLDSVLWVTKQPCAFAPCPWGGNLKYFDWAPATVKRNGSFTTTGTLDMGVGLDGVNPVHMDAVFNRRATGQVTLTLAISNCPYKWGTWVIYGN